MKNKVYTIDGIEYKCPPNINRIDTNGTRGWQVRFARMKEKYASKLFSSTEDALEHATIWCELQYAEMAHLRPEIAALAGKNFPTPSIVFKPRREGGIPQVFVECYVAYIGHHASHSSYVGTLNTVTREKLLSCLRRSAAIRRAFVAHCVEHDTYKGFDAAYVEENIGLWKLRYTAHIHFDTLAEDTMSDILVMKAKRAKPGCFAG